MVHWGIFSLTLFSLLAIDRIYNYSQKFTEFKRYLHLTILYFVAGLVFSFYIWALKDFKSFQEYLTCFILEKIMSVDNIFLIVLILNHFSIKPKFQNKIVIWGILGVIILRALAIWLGVTILSKFEWVLYIFGSFLVFKGVKSFYQNKKYDHNSQFKVENIWILKILKKKFNIPVHINSDQNDFIVKKNGKYIITNSFLALLSIEFVDLVFAIDSIPTIFGITQDIYIIYTSNIFAIVGLRAVFFLLKNTMNNYHFIKPALSIIMIFIGIKIIISHFITISPFFTLLILSLILIFSFIFFSKKTPNSK